MRTITLAITMFCSAMQAAAAGLGYVPASEIKATPVPLPAVSARIPSPLTPKHARNVLPANLPDNPLIVVHATKFFDETSSAKAGIDAAVAAFKAKGSPVIYLVHDQSAQGYAGWYPGDMSPDYELFSAGGEHNLPLRADSVTVIGGFFGSYDGSRGCQTLAVRDAIRMHFEYSDRPFTVNMPMKAMYYYEGDITTMKELMALPKDTPPEALIKEYKDFPESFFLVDNFVTSTEDSWGFGHPMLDLDAHPGYKPGEPVDTARYSFKLFIKGVKVADFGSGPRKVALNLF